MSFNSHKRVIGFVVIALMGGSPLLALAQTSKKKADPVAAVVKIPQSGPQLRAKKSGRTSKMQRRAHKNLKNKKSSKKMFVLNKKSGKKATLAKSKQTSKKKIAAKRMHKKIGVKKELTSGTTAKVAVRTQRETKALPRSVKPSKTH
jgi:hypothetical protein